MSSGSLFIMSVEEATEAFRKPVKQLVIKLGTGVLTSGIGNLDKEVIHGVCAQVAKIRKNRTHVIIVSSGAVGLGMGRLGLNKRPTDLATLQACASVGQSILTETWQSGFDPWGIHVGQMLLTREDLCVKKRHLAVRETLERLQRAGIVPIINENDCISVDELKFGDNDILSALVASLTKSDLLVLLSTIPGLMNLETQEVVPSVSTLDERTFALAKGTSSPTAVGGMVSKLEAARVASDSNCHMFIAHGREPEVLLKILNGDKVGTHFFPKGKSLRSQKRWLAFFQESVGRITVDPGAREAVESSGRSLLAKGVTSVDGSFNRDSIVDLIDSTGSRFARGVTQFSSDEILKIAGKRTEEIEALFEGRKHPEVIHRDDMVLLS